MGIFVLSKFLVLLLLFGWGDRWFSIVYFGPKLSGENTSETVDKCTRYEETLDNWDTWRHFSPKIKIQKEENKTL